jgi:hypothetical protein
VTLLDAPQFQALFDTARQSVFRLEGRQTYAVAADDAALLAFRTGAPRPERSVRTSPWLKRIAASTAVDGVSWSRVRVIEYPLTEYTRFELVTYIESQAAGEQILLTGQPAPCDDFWLIDAGTDHAVGVWMRYDDTGALLGRERVDDPAVIAEMESVAAAAASGATPLNVWLATADA